MKIVFQTPEEMRNFLKEGNSLFNLGTNMFTIMKENGELQVWYLTDETVYHLWERQFITGDAWETALIGGMTMTPDQYYSPLQFCRENRNLEWYTTMDYAIPKWLSKRLLSA